MPKKLVSERDILEFLKSGSKTLRIDSETILTPSAKDALIQHHVELVQGTDVSGKSAHSFSSVKTSPPNTKEGRSNPSTIAIGSDHGGFRLKESLKQFLTDLGYAVADVGTDSEEACDYPDFAFAVAKLVQSGEAGMGIMIDGVGVASAIVANKVPGIRAVPCYDEFVAKSSREHNNANLLTLGGRVVGTELAKSIVRVWLETPFAAGRHEARVRKIADVEQRYSRDH